ncbi:MAG: hypothetical protein HYU69_08875 [Bacteroidetes bacterium]|nr:hypothetical protein [Bacteroidota bacterium]
MHIALTTKENPVIGYNQSNYFQNGNGSLGKQDKCTAGYAYYRKYFGW